MLAWCSSCKQSKEIIAFHKNGNRRPYGLQSRCISCEKLIKDKRPRMKLLRDRIFEKLGTKCVRCGFDDIRALQIDHVNGGGKQEIKSFGTRWRQYYKAVLEDSTGKYQILCVNCNWIKRYEK